MSRGKKKKPKQKKRRVGAIISEITEHHCVPISRGGPDSDSNKVELFQFEHDAWHRLFKIMRKKKNGDSELFDLTSYEVEELIKEKTFLQITKGKRERECAWKMIFGREIYYWEKILSKLENLIINKENKEKDYFCYNIMIYLLNEGRLDKWRCSSSFYDEHKLKVILQEYLIFEKIKIIKFFFPPKLVEKKMIIKLPFDYLEYF